MARRKRLSLINVTKKHQCPQCGKVFDGPTALLQHRMDVHRLVASPQISTHGNIGGFQMAKPIDGTVRMSGYDKQLVNYGNTKYRSGVGMGLGRGQSMRRDSRVGECVIS